MPSSAYSRARILAPWLPYFSFHLCHSPHKLQPLCNASNASPDYALWYGWSEMRRDLTEIKELSAQMRREKRGATLKPAVRWAKDRTRETQENFSAISAGISPRPQRFKILTVAEDPLTRPSTQSRARPRQEV